MSELAPLRPENKNREHALRLALAFCVDDGRPLSAKRSIMKLRAAIKREGGNPPGSTTMYNWIERGVCVDGYPELEKHFEKVAQEVQDGEIDYGRWQAGIELGDALSRSVHDKALRKLGELMDDDGYAAIVKEKPELHLQAVARCTEAVKARGDTGSGDMWQMLDELDEEGAEKVIMRLLKKHTGLVEVLERVFAETTA